MTTYAGSGQGRAGLSNDQGTSHLAIGRLPFGRDDALQVSAHPLKAAFEPPDPRPDGRVRDWMEAWVEKLISSTANGREEHPSSNLQALKVQARTTPRFAAASVANLRPRSD